MILQIVHSFTRSVGLCIANSEHLVDFPRNISLEDQSFGPLNRRERGEAGEPSACAGRLLDTSKQEPLADESLRAKLRSVESDLLESQNDVKELEQAQPPSCFPSSWTKLISSSTADTYQSPDHQE